MTRTPPALATDPAKPGFERLAILTLGLFWQFVLVIYLIYKENGDIRWATLKSKLWLGAPRSVKTGKISYRLRWWIIPLLLLTAVYEMELGGYIGRIWTSIFPFLAEPPESIFFLFLMLGLVLGIA